jgi:hypothetical protein
MMYCIKELCNKRGDLKELRRQVDTQENTRWATDKHLQRQINELNDHLGLN